MNKFPERLKQLRKEKGITQKQLAYILGFSQSAISFWEIGLRSPDGIAIVTLSRLFNVTTDYLLGLVD